MSAPHRRPRALRLIFSVLLCALWSFAFSSCPHQGYVEYDAGDEAFVRRALPYVLGRDPRSLAELQVMLDIIEQTDRATFVRSLTGSPAYVERWRAWVYDALAVNRNGDRANPLCYQVGAIDGADGGELAALVRDAAPAEARWGSPWTMKDLADSALLLDDLSPLYRAQLFPPIPAEMQPPNLLEARSQRGNLAEIFEATYLNRQAGCMVCHNSAWSATDHPEPELDRTWPVQGYFEQALFGAHEGQEHALLEPFFRRRGFVVGFSFGDEPAPPSEDALIIEDGVVPDGFDGCQPLWPAHAGCDGCPCEEQVCAQEPGCCEFEWRTECAALCRGLTEGSCGPDPIDSADRYAPWGMDRQCGAFVHPDAIEPDITGEPGVLVQDWGPSASIYDVERLLASGVERLRGEGLRVEPDLSVPGPAGFAFLVALNVADLAWAEATGERLTISHSFPRNQDQQELLTELGQTFASHGFSLSELLVAITTHPLFNQRAPAELGVMDPYALPPLVNPWSIEEDVERLQGNSLGDVVHPYPPRVQIRRTHEALGWQPMTDFAPGGESDPGSVVLGGMGAFMNDADPGFRGVSFQSSLVWEQYYSHCVDPTVVPRMEGCTPRDEPDCPGCECRVEVCGDLPHCCSESWDERCAARCYMVNACVDFDRPVERPADFIDEVLAAAAGRPWSDAVSAIKERLLLDPVIEPDEAAVLAGLVGGDLESPLPSGQAAEEGLRAACGVLLGTPQYLMASLPGPDRAGTESQLGLPGEDYQASCERLAGQLDGLTLRCAADGVMVQ